MCSHTSEDNYLVNQISCSRGPADGKGGVCQHHLVYWTSKPIICLEGGQSSKHRQGRKNCLSTKPTPSSLRANSRLTVYDTALLGDTEWFSWHLCCFWILTWVGIKAGSRESCTFMLEQVFSPSSLYSHDKTALLLNIYSHIDKQCLHCLLLFIPACFLQQYCLDA